MAGTLNEDANRALAVAAMAVGHDLQVLVVAHQLPAARALTVKTQESMTFFVNDWNQSSSMEVEGIVMSCSERRVVKA
jgi:ABC-type nickel/cobalt efflux system permease component RcnA